MLPQQQPKPVDPEILRIQKRLRSAKSYVTSLQQTLSARRKEVKTENQRAKREATKKRWKLTSKNVKTSLDMDDSASEGNPDAE
jgi:hypothetical protein